MRYILPILLIIPFLSLGQDKVPQKKTDQEVYNEGRDSHSKVLIIPFEPKMYISSADKDISMHTGLNHQQIRDNMRYGISDHMLRSVGGNLKAVSLLHLDTGSVAQDLNYIYNSIGYKYKDLPIEDVEQAKKAEEDSKAINKVKGQFNKLIKKDEKATAEESGSRIKDGQIHTVRDNREKFMNTSIHNPNLLKTIGARYEADVFLFINELDIEEAAEGDRVGLSSLSYKRKVKMHYTIFDINGKEIHGGAAMVYMPAHTNDMNRIINGYFPKIGESMSGHLPAAHTSKEDQQLQKEQEQKAEEQRSEIEKL